MKRQTVSLCMIARDEEATIGMAIKSVLALVDEIVVVDTGSHDNTRIIAEGYGARVIDLAWATISPPPATPRWTKPTATGSCSWMRTSSCSRSDRWSSRGCCNDPGAAAYRLRMISARPGEVDQVEGRVRLFRHLPEVRYRYPIFERVLPT